MSTPPNGTSAPPLGREPVASLVGLLGMLLVWLISLIPGLDATLESTLQGAVPALLSVVAAALVRPGSKPTVVIGGIIAGVFTALVGHNVSVSEGDQLLLQEAVLSLVMYLTRQNTNPKVPPS